MRYTHSGTQCTRTTAARASCPADFDPPSLGICFKRTPAVHSCSAGTPRGTDCVTIEPSTATYICPSGDPDENNQCTDTQEAGHNCDSETPADGKCPHTHPTINDLPATATHQGTTYTDDFSVDPPGSTVLASGAGCALSAPSSTGHYTLTVTNPDPDNTENVAATCSVAAVHTHTTTAAITVTFTPDPSDVVHTRRPASPQNLRCTAATATTATWTWDAADRAHTHWYRYSSSDDWAEAGGAGARSHTRTAITPSSGAYGGWDNWQYIRRHRPQQHRRQQPQTQQTASPCRRAG